MNRDAKRINPGWRKQIDIHKGFMIDSPRPFDGDGYAFHTAIKELRAAGHIIERRRAMCHYVYLGRTV